MLPNDGDALFDQRGLSAFFNDQVAIATLEKWRVLGRGPRFIRVGRKVFYRRRDVEQWLTSNTVTHTHEQPQAIRRDNRKRGRLAPAAK